jgi:lysophospholipase L1-like esterase
MTTPPLNLVLSKFLTSQPVTLLFIGDSTIYGVGDTYGGTFTNGWPGRLGVKLGNYYNYNVNIITWNYPNNTAYNNSGDLTSRTLLSVGVDRPTLTLWSGGWPGGIMANYLSKASAMLSIDTNPDAVFAQDVFNETDTNTFVSNYKTFIGNIHTYCPNSPIIITTANPIPGTTGGNGGNIAALLSGLMTALLPGISFGWESNPSLNPPVQESTTYPGVWIIDTSQMSWNNSTDIYSSPHPNAVGYQVQANWMYNVLVSSIQVITLQNTNLNITFGNLNIIIGQNFCWQLTNITKMKFLNGTLNPNGNFKCALVTDASNISKDSTDWASVTGEISNINTGYTTGGITVSPLVLSGTTSVLCQLVSDLSWLAGNAGLTANKVVLYEVGGNVIGFCPLRENNIDVTIDSGNTLFIDHTTNPIFALT